MSEVQDRENNLGTCKEVCFSKINVILQTSEGVKISDDVANAGTGIWTVRCSYKTFIIAVYID